MRKTNILGALTLAGIVAFSGCDNTTTTQQKSVVCQDISQGQNIRIMTVTSDKHYWSKKEIDIKAKVEEVVNGGKYNVISVKTFYSNAYLTSAEIKYNVGEPCDNRKLQVMFVNSNQFYLYRKQNEVKPKLDELVNSGKYNIKDVNTIMLKGYLVAAEIYHYKN